MRKKIFWLSISLSTLLAIVVFLSCGKKKAVPEKSFLNLVPRDSFIYLGFKDWKVLRDETGAFNFLKTARRLELGVRLRKILEEKQEIKPEARKAALKLQALRDKVSLWELLGGEIALVGFPTEKGEKPVLAFLCRLPEGKAELYQGYFEELIGLMARRDIANFIKKSSFLEETLTTLDIPDLPIDSRPTWSAVGDIFILASRREGSQELVARLKGKSRKDSLIENQDFQRAFRGLSLDAQGVIYIQVDDFTQWARRLFRYQKTRIEENLKKEGMVQGLESPEARQVLYYLQGLLKVVSTVEVVAGNSGLSEEGYWELLRYYLDEKEGSQALLALLKCPPRNWGVLDYIPSNVPSLSVGYLDLEKVYRPLLKYITANPVHGEVVVKRWAEVQETLGFKLEEDLLSWLGDEYGACTMSLSKSMTDPGSFAFFWKVKSEAKIEATLDKLFALVQEKAQASLNIVEDEYEGYKMKVIYLPLPVLSITPTLGKVEDYLILASRKEDFKKVVDTFRRKEKSIRRDKDFIRMQKRLGSRGTEFSFSRLEDRIDALITFVRSMSSFFGMAAAVEASKSGEAQQDPQEITSLLNDAAQVLEDLKVFKFYGRSSAFSEGYVEYKEFIEIERSEKR